MSHLEEGVLHAVLDGEIPARELTAIQEHLAGCAECQLRFTEARQFRDEAFGIIEKLDPAPVAIAAVAASPAVGTFASRRRPRWPVPLAWAATLVGALGLGYLVGDRRAGVDLADRPAPMEVAASAPRVGDRETPAGSTDEDLTTTAPTGPKETGQERDQAPVVTPPSNQTAIANRVAASAGARQLNERARRPADDSTVPSQPAKASALEPARAKAEPAPAPTSVAAAELKDAREEQRAAPPPSLDRARSSLAAETRSGAQGRSFRRDLLKTDGPVAPNPADQRRRTISAVAAISALGGSIRLVDGLTPSRFELQGEVVRVVYRTALGVVVLEQWRAGELLAHELITPPEVPADSIRAWESRIR
jgi:hypothetical protein